MWKLIFWGIIIWIVIQLLKRGLKINKNQAPMPNNEDEANIDSASFENMVQCEQCQVHLPRSEAFLVNGKFYCSKAHIKSDTA